MKSFNRAGFTLKELLVVIGIVAVLISIFIPWLNKAREDANRLKCAENLSQIGKAMLLYSNENKGSFPRTRAGTGGAMTLDFTNAGAGEANPFSAAVPDNSIPASMFLLVRTQELPTSVFTCPSGTADTDLMNGLSATSRSNFTGDATGRVIRNVGYSFINVFPTTTARSLGYQSAFASWMANYAIAADLSPGSSTTQKLGADPNLSACVVGAPRSVILRGNSKNHDQAGQNVLYADGHAEFMESPLCGIQNDHIYTANGGTSTQLSTDGASTTGSDPTHAGDAVLVIDIVNLTGP